MSGPVTPESTFLQHLVQIDRIAAKMARLQGLSGDEAADMSSWVKLKLVENDYAAFRKFRGESTVSTYLTVVIAMLARDYRVQRWGRWRPSAAARRHGNLAIRLEALIHRQGYQLHQAAELLRTSGETRLSDREVAGLFARLPARQPLRPRDVGPDSLGSLPASGSAESLVENEAVEREQTRARETLERVMTDLPTEDRVLLRMRFWENLSVAEIARALCIDQKPLYRRIERLLALLRERLTANGVTREQIAELLNETSQ
jgi:RNA polymerase sigma factor for flagellar operon FliA